jgi:hypothetical protein
MSTHSQATLSPAQRAAQARVLTAILHRARQYASSVKRLPDGDVELTLLQVLRAYEEVLREQGQSPNEDSRYYRILLQWSLSARTYYEWRRCLASEAAAEIPPADSLSWNFLHNQLVAEGQAPTLKQLPGHQPSQALSPRHTSPVLSVLSRDAGSSPPLSPAHSTATAATLGPGRRQNLSPIATRPADLVAPPSPPSPDTQLAEPHAPPSPPPPAALADAPTLASPVSSPAALAFGVSGRDNVSRSLQSQQVWHVQPILLSPVARPSCRSLAVSTPCCAHPLLRPACGAHVPRMAALRKPCVSLPSVRSLGVRRPAAGSTPTGDGG